MCFFTGASLLSLFCFIIAVNSESNRLLLTPSVAYALVGDDVTFLCIKDDPSLEIAWIPVLNVFHSNNENVSTLITGVPDTSFNNTEIQCVGRYSSEPSILYRSNKGKVLIQGKLSEVDVNISRINVCTVQLSWVPPFTLPGVPILGYNVNITNLDNNITSSSFINHTNIDFTLGYDYYVSIAAVNGAGEGNKTITGVNSTKLINFTKRFNINIVGLMRDQDKWKVDANINVTMICGNADAKFACKFCNNASCFSTRNIIKTELSNSQALLSTLLYLPEDQYYDVQVEAIVGKNAFLSFGTSLSTFDVQSVNANSPASRIICLSIYYVTGSAATGCQMSLDCNSNNTFLFNVDGYNSQFHKFWCFPEIPLVGIKTCFLDVYDRVGQINQNTSGPAVESFINVTGAIATPVTPVPPTSADSNCSTKLITAVTIAVPISVIFTLIITLMTIIIVYAVKKRCGKFRPYSKPRAVTPQKKQLEPIVCKSCHQELKPLKPTLKTQVEPIVTEMAITEL